MINNRKSVMDPTVKWIT